MTVLAFERHPVEPSADGAFGEWLRELLAAIRAQPGVLWAGAGRADDDEPSYIVLSEWRTAADLDAWEASAPRGELVAKADALLREDPTRRRFSAAT